MAGHTMLGKNSLERMALAVRIAIIAAAAILWEMLARNNTRVAFYTSFPTEIARELLYFATSGGLFRHVGITLAESYLGLFYGSLAGISLGILCGQFSTFGKIFAPIVSALQGIPQLTLAPLYILWFGIGLQSKVILSALMVFFNVFISTYGGIRNTDQKLIEAATLLGASKGRILWHIVLPASMPWILAGIRIGVSVCMVGAIIGEYIGSSGGLGWMVSYASSFFQIKRAMACIAVLLVIGLVVNAVLDSVERYLLRWRAATNLGMRMGRSAASNL